MSKATEAQEDDFSFVRHNETDYVAFQEFKKGMDARYEATRADRERTEKIRRYQNWLARVPERWADAQLKTMRNREVAKQAMARLRSGGKGFYITGDHGMGKTHAAYAILRTLIVSDKARAAEVAIISELELSSLATGGFESRPRLDELTIFGDYKVFFLDSAGLKGQYDSKREAPAFAALIERAYETSAYFIVASHLSFEDYAEMLPEAAASKLQTMMTGGLLDLGRESVIEAPEAAHRGPKNADPHNWGS